MLERLGLMPVEASTLAGRVDALYYFLVGVTAFFSLLIAVLIVRFAVKYRRRRDDEYPQPIHGSLALELLWTIVPFMITMVIFVWGASLFVAIKRPPNDALQVLRRRQAVDVEAAAPRGPARDQRAARSGRRPVRLTLTSEDVIHSFYVPAFRVKQDAVPGPLHDAVVQGDEARQVPSLLRRVLRHAALGHDRLDRRDGPGRLPGVAAASGSGGPGAAEAATGGTPPLAVAGGRALRRARVRTPATATSRARSARRSAGVAGSTVQLCKAAAA